MVRAVICDDEQAAYGIIRYFIESENLPIEIVGTAENGKTALDLIEREKPELAFMDIHMPYMDGFEVIQKIQNTKIIVMTAYGSFQYAQKALRLGVSDIISKPIELEQLQQAITRAIGWNFTSNETVNSMLTYIHTHYMEKIELEDLAKNTFCSESHLARIFKKHMNMTIVSYINKLRVQKAAQYLKEERLSIQGAAEKVGYQNMNNFYKNFKLYMHETPAGYLQKFRKA